MASLMKSASSIYEKRVRKIVKQVYWKPVVLVHLLRHVIVGGVPFLKGTYKNQDALILSGFSYVCFLLQNLLLVYIIKDGHHFSYLILLTLLVEGGDFSEEVTKRFAAVSVARSLLGCT